MNMKYLSLVLVALCLSSCKMVEYYDYVHKPTHDIRQKLIWQQGSVKPISKLTDEPVLLIPNLREFTPSYHERNVKLFVCSDKKEKIMITEAILLNDDTGYKITSTPNREVQLDQRDYKENGPYRIWIYLFRESSLDYTKFTGSSSITLIVKYRLLPPESDSEVHTKTYELKLKTVKDVAWPT